MSEAALDIATPSGKNKGKRLSVASKERQHLTQASLAKRPYDLRHSALSAWLCAGADPAEVAPHLEWHLRQAGYDLAAGPAPA